MSPTIAQQNRAPLFLRENICNILFYVFFMFHEEAFGVVVVIGIPYLYVLLMALGLFLFFLNFLILFAALYASFAT